MRIISGKNRGRQIVAPENLPVRPTTDLGKESLFNILNNYFFLDRIHVLDLFSGTGNLSYEFASRGALSVVSVDSDSRCANFIRKTAEKLDYTQIAVVRHDAFEYVAACRRKFNVIFADPPYALTGIEKIVQDVFRNELLAPDGWLVIEHSKEKDFSRDPHFFQHRTYGKVNFTFLVNLTDESETEQQRHE